MGSKTFAEELVDGEEAQSPISPSPSSTPERPQTALKTAHAYLSILILFINYFLAQYDKFVLSYFRADVEESLGLTSTQYGLISGYTTGIALAILALPVAFIADHTSARVWTLSIAATWWSLCVIFQGLSHNFTELYCARLGMGIGQAAVEALSISLISDLVGWRSVFIGNSVLYVGVYVGEAVSGQIANAFTKTGTGWQVAMRAIGITGIVVAVVLRVVLREPERRQGLVLEADEAVPKVKSRSLKAVKGELVGTVRYIMRMRSFWLLVASAAMRQLAGNVFGYYMPGYVSSLYPNEADLLSRYGIVVGTVGSATVLFGGVLTSVLWTRTKLTPIYLTSIGGMISSIFVLLMIFSRDIAGGDETRGVKIFYGTMALAYATAELWLGCLFALVALLLPPAYKTFGLAIWSSFQVLVYSSGPEIMGLALRNEDPDSESYITVTRNCLAIIIVIGYWACGIGLLFAVPLVKKDFDQRFARLGRSRKMAFGGAAVVVVCLVIVLFTLSLIYDM